MVRSDAVPVEPAIVERWLAVLGPEHVISAPSRLQAAETATFETSQRIPLILRPGSVDEVSACLRIASEAHIPVYPISTGRNWGYGSRVPVESAVLMDLGRMNRITEFNEKLGCVTLEPGVTQRQLLAFLRERKSGLWMDATGSGLDTSLIGNVVERGFGHTPMADRFGQVCGLEVVLASGEVIQTGFARFPNAAARQAYRWGLGPVLDGLFSQSNFGVVTRATLWLMPAPEHFEALFFRIDDHSKLPALVEALRPLRMNGIIRSALHLGNDYKVLAGLQAYPWDRTGGRSPLTEEMMPQFRKELNFGAWNGLAGLYGTRGQVRESKRIIRSTLGPVVDKLQFVDERLLRIAERFQGVYKMVTGWDLSRTLQMVKPVLGLLKGEPSDQPLESTYWRKRGPRPATMDPDRDGCGLLWTGPVAPMEGEHAERIVSIAKKVMLGHGFEPLISITFLTERALACVLSITWDRDVPGEDQRAQNCYRDLLAQVVDEGYYPYRLAINSMHLVTGDETYTGLLRTLKYALDPTGILAPGRYAPAPPAS